MNYRSPQQPPHPQALAAFRKHSDLLRHLHGLLEAATEEARTFFREDGEPRDGYPHDGHYFSHQVRYGLYRRLHESDARSRLGMEVFRLPMTGIELRHRSDRFKIWKAVEDGDIPPTGLSRGRQDYVAQGQMPLFPEADQLPRQTRGNAAKLILLWDVDAMLSLSLVKLVCPAGWETEWRPGDEHWSMDVPHPANWIEPTDDFSSDGSDDLDIDLDQPEAGGDE